MSMTSVAVLIVSDEALETSPKNNEITSYLIEELNSLGFKVNKVSVIREEINEICYDIDYMKKYSDILLIVARNENGTVFKALAKLFSQELSQNHDLHQVLQERSCYFTDEEVLLPNQAKLITGNCNYPVIDLQQVFVLNEEFLCESFANILRDRLEQYRKEPRFVKSIKVNLNGNSNKISSEEIAKYANSNGIVSCGCSRESHSLSWSISSSDFAKIAEVEEEINNRFQSYDISSSDESNIWRLIWDDQEAHVRKAIEDIESCLEQYGPENIFVSFNGGKDCTVLFHLILVVIKNRYSDFKQALPCLYVQSSNPFPEQDEFIVQCQLFYNLEIITIQCGIKQALEESLLKNPNYKACFMGSRRTDPYCSDLNVFQMTDPNWPQIMRVSPLLDWNYTDIWNYLLYYKVPYCKLYDMGFTSLGNTINTAPNPSLQYFNIKEEKEMYLPAYKLLTDSKERSGRENS